MMGSGFGEMVSIPEELIIKACSMARKAHKSGKPYLIEKSRSSSEAVFSFCGSWRVDAWFARPSFGETKINLQLFPSLKNISTDEVALVNESFLRRFEEILLNTSLQNEVEKVRIENKQVLFTGHSSGAAIAILATLYFLEKGRFSNNIQSLLRCVTFGSPLIGDRILPHSLQRENWSQYFVHFIMKYDIVPRILFTPLSYIEQELQGFLQFFKDGSIGRATEPTAFFTKVMRNTFSVTSYAASKLKGCTNLLLETVTSFTELSPYRPFGTYVFCTGNGKLVVVRNPNAILQLLFYCAQLGSEAEAVEVAYKSLQQHLAYESELHDCLQMQNVIGLEHLVDIPLSSIAGANDETVTINMALNDLGLSTRAKLDLRAAGELEKRKKRNQATIDKKKKEIEDSLCRQQNYQTKCKVRGVGYYDSFKQSKEDEDFQANVRRIELAGMWDEIVEMLKRYELPEGFEAQEEWIKLGTRYRRIVEPLDIANYYRHDKNDDTGPYLKNGRPKRYKFTQRWHEHAKNMGDGSSSESCFWAEVEELRSESAGGSFGEVKERVLCLEKKILKWVQQEELEKDVFLKESTFTKWWNTLPPQHRLGSCIAIFMSN